jgi:UDP-N-acetyl-alpha-D-muramoyl-L-alanyl-L-glutamate epimerase
MGLTVMQSGPFIFERYEFRNATGVLHLYYRFEQGPSFEEKISFPPAARTLSPNELAALDASFRLVFLLAGVSYYKIFVSEHLQCTAFALDKETADFIEKIYRKGLAEFAYKNKVDLSDRVRFTAEAVAPRTASPLALPRRSLVPVGGGKDSIVTLEYLKESGEPLTLFALGASSGIAAPIEATIAESGLPAIKVTRELAPNLTDLNKAGAFNGHVPITAILSAIAVTTAILHGFDTVILSNEHSASAPNLRMNENEINHQYSKSFDFETGFSKYVIDHVAADLRYFSLLRPFSEAEIARRFARFTKYHPIFRSCNKAFKQDAATRSKNWCCDCAKCRFVFLALAPFVEKERLIGIFGKNILDDTTQKEGFAELCGLTAHKPFECVGETFESALLMEKLFHDPAWKNDAVVAELGKKLHEPKDFERLYEGLFATNPDHNVPEHYMRMLDACR